MAEDMAEGGTAEGVEVGADAGGAVADITAAGDTEVAGAGPDIMPGGVILDTTIRTIMVMDPIMGRATAIPMDPTVIGGAATIFAAAMEAGPTAGTWSTAPIVID